MAVRRLHVDLLTRIEGEGALDLQIENGRVSDARLRIFEPPRLFEALLRGRHYTEAPDITARICGICPVAYQMSAVHAIERAAGVQIGGPLRALRRLLYCGEWIESHALHVVMLHAPDFLGYANAIEMARDHRAALDAGLQLKRAGNAILRTLGGREIHPVNVRVGGFYRVAARAERAPLAGEIERARDCALAILRWTSGFPLPDFTRDYELVALRHPQEYPFNEGRIVSSRGLDIDPAEFDTHFEERQVAHSTALHAVIRRRGSYLVGPLARYGLNFDRLTPEVQSLAREVGLGPLCRNPFQSILVRTLEAIYACEEALRLIATYEPPEAPYVAVEVRAGTGQACTEAPRGLCHHLYEIDASGMIRRARIVPPTSQNQLSIEQDLREIASRHLSLSDDDLRDRCEQAIRNHDPCISCSAHFLKLTVHRS